MKKHWVIISLVTPVVLLLCTIIYLYYMCPVTIRNNTGQNIRKIEFKAKGFQFKVDNLHDKSKDTFRRNLGSDFDFHIKIHFEDGKTSYQRCRGSSVRKYNKIVFVFNPNGQMTVTTRQSKVKELWEFMVD
jgi:hypothetical protein